MAILANTKDQGKNTKITEPWHMGTHLRVLSEGYPLNTNMTGFRCFSKSLGPYELDQSSLGRVNEGLSNEYGDPG